MSGEESWLDRKGLGAVSSRVQGEEIQDTGLSRGPPGLPLCPGQTPRSPETWLKVTHSAVMALGTRSGQQGPRSLAQLRRGPLVGAGGSGKERAC